MGESRIGLGEYFNFYNGERPHQSLGFRTPEAVYRMAAGGGARIVDRYPRKPVESPVALRSTGDSTGLKHPVGISGAAPCSCG